MKDKKSKKVIRKYFIKGLIAIIPVALILWIGNILYTPLSILFGNFGVFPLVLGLTLGIGAIFTLGVLLDKVKFVAKGKSFIEKKFVNQIPVLKSVYKLSGDLAKGALADKIYDQTVYVYPYGKYGAMEVGFLTNKRTGTVFVPSAPNPLNGRLYFGCRVL